MERGTGVGLGRGDCAAELQLELQQWWARVHCWCLLGFSLGGGVVGFDTPSLWYHFKILSLRSTAATIEIAFG